MKKNIFKLEEPYSYQKNVKNSVHVFGMRRMSPMSSFHLINFLNRVKPLVVLIDAPYDTAIHVKHFLSEKRVPPFAVSAYPNGNPSVKTVLPFTIFSPEYNAAIWGSSAGVNVDFIGLPFSVSIALRCENSFESGCGCVSPCSYVPDVKGVYDQPVSEHLFHWDNDLEYCTDEALYSRSLYDYAVKMRDAEPPSEKTLLKESFMMDKIAKFLNQGHKPSDIAVISGFYHVPAIAGVERRYYDERLKNMKRCPSTVTVYDYSYLRIAALESYRGVEKNPGYFEILWKSIRNGEAAKAPYFFLANIADNLNERGLLITQEAKDDASRLAFAMANKKGKAFPSLSDLRLSAEVCYVCGDIPSVDKAFADIGAGVAAGVFKGTCKRLADNFYEQINLLRLQEYQSGAQKDLVLDLRNVKAAKRQILTDLNLNRSFFLNRLNVLGIPFVYDTGVMASCSVWKESWKLCWNDDSQIRLDGCSIYGRSIASAASCALKHMLRYGSVADKALVIYKAVKCGLPYVVSFASNSIGKDVKLCGSFQELSTATALMSFTIDSGVIRKADLKTLSTLLADIFSKGLEVFMHSCMYNGQVCSGMPEFINIFNNIAMSFSRIVDADKWEEALYEAANSFEISSFIAGYAAAVLIERDVLGDEEFKDIVLSRLSHKTSLKDGGSWFEGVVGRNYYALISKKDIWNSINEHISTLNDRQFLRVLVFLRRSLYYFSPDAKRKIFENFGTGWESRKDSFERKIIANLMKKRSKER